MKENKIKSFSKIILTGLLVLMLLTGIYSILTEGASKPESVSFSQLVSEINADRVSKITVKGNNLEILFGDNTEKTAKKESETALSQTLFSYGVSADALKKVSIEIKEPSGAWFWLGNILPFLLPLFIFGFTFLKKSASSPNTQKDLPIEFV